MLPQILIADRDRDFARGLADRLVEEGYDKPLTATGMPEALHILQEQGAQLLITDLVLETGDGWGLLDAAAVEGVPISTMVVTTVWSPGIRQALCDRNVACAVRKPISRDVILRSIDACLVAEEPPSLGRDLESACLRTVAGLGMHYGYDGMIYVQYGLRLMCKHDGVIPLRVTKELYPQIARSLRVRAEVVESSIRYALGRAWEEGDPGRWARLCAETGRPFRRPTASELFRMVGQWVLNHPEGGFS